MNYEEALDWLYSTQNFGIKLGLENMTRLLRETLSFPRFETQVIQVAGTNGKGSTCAFLDSLIRATGRRVGLFTSPHLICYRERIQINGQQIPEETVARELSSLRERVSSWENHPTFFELTLALAMRHFYQEECEVVILEVGMGGRFDATSAVPSDAAVITPIGLDHQQWLGDTLAEIAGEKSAICREGKPVVSAQQEPEAARVIAETANETRAPLTWVTEPIRGYPLGLTGGHQAENAALALETLSALDYPLNYDSVHQGLEKATNPGRFEVSESKTGQKFIFDIAHNPHAIAALVGTLKASYSSHPPALIFGAAESKDISKMLALLSPLVSTIHFCPINSPRAVSPKDLRSLLPEEIRSSAHEHDSLVTALSSTKSENTVLVAGSAFLVGETKALLQESEHRTTNQ